jgi:iron(III) transport system ATP-binding protein
LNLEFRHIAHTYDTTPALADVSLTAAGGEITCLLGASGCGKSTLLSLAAGLLDLQAGEIWLGDERLAAPGDCPAPEARPIGLVFQDGALFPHMTLAQNIAFGLPRAARDPATIERWLVRVGLAGLGRRYPHQLSGGQQQRAALARAMAPEPAVLLMDEPFASVDIVLRRALRRECRLLLRERAATTLLVTHDPDEALDIADRIAVMEGGRIVQVGTPAELYDAPAAPSVGAIFGGAQIVAAEIKGGAYRTPFGFWPARAGVQPVGAEGAAVDLLVHARCLRLEPDRDGLTVHDRHELGDRVRVLLRHHTGLELTAELGLEAAETIHPEQRYRALPDDGSVRVFGRDEGH